MHKRLAALFASLMISSLVTLIGCDMGRSQQAGSQVFTAGDTIAVTPAEVRAEFQQSGAEVAQDRLARRAPAAGF